MNGVVLASAGSRANLISLFLGSLERVDVNVDFDSIEREILVRRGEALVRRTIEKYLHGAARAKHRNLTARIEKYASALEETLEGMREALARGGARGLLEYLARVDSGVRLALECFASCRNPPNRRVIKTRVGCTRSLGYRWREWCGLVVDMRYYRSKRALIVSVRAAGDS